MKKALTYIIILIPFSLPLKSQNPNGSYNPYVNGGLISSSPLWPAEVNGSGVISFNVGNTGSDPLQIYTAQQIVLTITLSQGEPNHINPLSAIGGSSAGLFSWTYNAGTFRGTQIATIPASSSGTITIDYKVTQNSALPGSNGFYVDITPAPYQTTSNTQNDDAVSSYTFTEIHTGSTGLTIESSQVIITPASNEIHELVIYPNPSVGTVTLEIAEFSGKYNLLIFHNNGSIVQQSEINFNESKYNLNVNHLRTGVYDISLFNDRSTYFGKLVIQK